MEEGESRRPGKRRRRCCVILSVVALLVIIIIAVVLGLTVRQEDSEIKSAFFSRCERFSGNDCQNIWRAFQQAYVDKDPCAVPVEAYEPLLAAAPFKAECGRMMFWSKTKDVVHEFSEKTCFTTLEDTLLGSVLDDLTWCGKEGSKDTFTTDCPSWRQCENNPVSSFWKSASAAFADVACGNVTAMLNGSISTPFSPTSIFGSVEVKRFNATRTKSLNVVMVIQKNAVTNCTNASLKDLQGEMANKGINYNCKDVNESQLQECSSRPVESCGTCW